jgi:hypothetical protein
MTRALHSSYLVCSRLREAFSEAKSLRLTLLTAWVVHPIYVIRLVNKLFPLLLRPSLRFKQIAQQVLTN